MATGKIRISGESPGCTMRGQQLRIELIDEDGKATMLPATSIQLDCAGRSQRVRAQVWLEVSELDVEVSAEIFKHDDEG